MEITIHAKPEPIKLNTERTAVLVVDMQNGFCKKGGMLDLLGILPEEMVNKVIKTSKKVIDACRRKGIKIIYIRMAFRPDLLDAGGPNSPNPLKELGLVAMRKNPEWKGKFITFGTWDCEVVDEIKPQPGDITVDKNRYSGFTNTELNTILLTHNIKHLIFMGLATNICVESTLRDAFFHEYFPVLVSDGCGNFGPACTQEATIWNVTNLFGWVTDSDDLVKALK